MAVIQKLRNKKTGRVYNNVELAKACYGELVKLRDGIGAQSPAEKDRMEDAFYRICGGSQNANEVMAFLKQVDDAPTYEEAQKFIARGLIPVENIRK